MQVRLEGFSIVIVGNWNPAIFSPKWIIGTLTNSKEINFEFPMEAASLPPLISFDGMKLRVSPARLELFPGDSTLDSLARIQNTATKILSLLEHTPITAIGVNFQWIEDEPPEALQKLFGCPDRDNLADRNWLINETSLTRKLMKDGKLLNLIFVEKADGKYVISANFHTECSGLMEAINALSSGVNSLQDAALEVLQSTYGLVVN